ncbi:MAG TPA: hypothetical protein VNS55_14455 [Nocardioides sp.]|nr:hypothetical protein [Nocardioides sp.]
MSRRWRAAATASSLVLAAAVLTPSATLAPAAGARTPATYRAALPATSTAFVQRVRISWQESQNRPQYSARAMAPGITPVRMVCRPDATFVGIRPYDRSDETQMWVAKYEQKSAGPVVAVKNVRVYTAANANDHSGSGTGPTAYEGLNQERTPEDSSHGYLHGVISSRPGRDQPAGGVAVPQPTSFTLDWSWGGLRDGGRDAWCVVHARFVTQMSPAEARARAARDTGVETWVRALDAPALAVNWHGEDDAVGHETDSSAWAGLGTLDLECRVGRDSDHALWLREPDPTTWIWVETVTGEGLVTDHVSGEAVGVDPVEHWVGPIDLPRNGIVRIFVTTATGAAGSLIVSSYVKDNDHDPRLDLCETGIAAWLE